MDCAEFRGLAPAGVDGELAPEDDVRLRQHAAECEPCADVLLLRRREVDLITTALRDPTLQARTRRRPPRALWAAAVLLVLAVAAAVGLESTYRETGMRLAAARERGLTESLDTPIRIRSRNLPLGEFVSEVADRTGLPIRLADGAIDRLGEEPVVRIELSAPIRLRSLLGLLEDFYGLRPVITGEGFVLNPGENK